MNLKSLKIIVGLVIISSCARSHSVPKEVEIAFAAQFPMVNNPKWEMENDTEWEAEFKMDGEKYSAIFDESGAWKATEHEIKMSDLPDAVKVTILENHANYKVEEVELIQSSTSIAYEVELKNNKEEIVVIFDESGGVISFTDSENNDDD